MAMNRHQRRAISKGVGGKSGRASPDFLNQLVHDGISLSNDGNLPEAERKLRQALKLEPSHVEAKHQLGVLLGRTGRSDEGIPLLREVVAALPKEALYWSNLAAACYGAADTQGAVEAARKAVELEPGYGLAWDNLGSALMDQNDYAAAAGALECARELGASDLQSIRRLSACYFHLVDYANAERCLRDVLVAEPNDVETLANLGAILLNQRDYAAAKDMLTGAVAISPDHFGSAYHLGKVLTITGETEQGLRWLRRATSSQPSSAVGWRELAAALYDAGKQKDAEIAVDRALALAPGSSETEDLSRRIRGTDNIFNLVLPTVEFPPRGHQPGVVDLTVLKIGS